MSTKSLHASAVDVLRGWVTTTEDDESLRHTYLAFLESAPEACLRKHVPGHITASSLVLDHSGTHVLLTLHPRVGKWIQLGGHCEKSDATVLDAAFREATEESGMPGLTIDPELLWAHSPPITCSLGVPPRHLDLRFLVRAPEGAIPVCSSESRDLAWWPVDDLPAGADHHSVGRLLELARARGALAA